uniref:Uncharacterized protein n=1 Tax=Helianthus annuus TaxID=4232 RepID=A0A251S5C2_HELAN
MVSERGMLFGRTTEVEGLHALIDQTEVSLDNTLYSYLILKLGRYLERCIVK